MIHFLVLRLPSPPSPLPLHVPLILILSLSTGTRDCIGHRAEIKMRNNVMGGGRGADNSLGDGVVFYEDVIITTFVWVTRCSGCV